VRSELIIGNITGLQDVAALFALPEMFSQMPGVRKKMYVWRAAVAGIDAIGVIRVLPPK